MDKISFFGLICEILLLILALLIIPKLRKLAVEKLGDDEAERLFRFIAEFVDAAEQVGKVLCYTGAQKKEYVIERLEEIGYELTPAIDAYIEAAVFKMKGGV